MCRRRPEPRVDAANIDPEEAAMKLVAIIGTIAATLVLAAAAAAGTGNGANVVNNSGCVTTPLATMCFDIHTVTNMTTTPSGDVSYVTNGTSTTSFDFAFAGCTYSKSEPVHLHQLVKNGETHSESGSIGQTIAFDCGAFEQTCTSTLQYHYVDGETQFQRPEFICTP
jgi:hypothetical protein